MNKIINFIILYISLFIVETISSFLILLFDFDDDLFNFKGSFDVAILWNFWRILFYGLPFIILYSLLFKFFISIRLYKHLLFSLFNLSIYIALSVLSRVIWGKNVLLSIDVMMFYVTCVSIFLSPIALGQIPYFRRLMENL